MADLLVHHWSHPTTPAGTGWDIVQTGVRLLTEKGFSARAALGEAEVIRVMVDDPTGTADYKTLHRWYMVETATSGQQLVWNGYISDQYIDRGEMGDLIHPFGTARRWELELTQENTLLGFRVVQGIADAAHGVRAAESPGVRLLWLLSSPYLSTVVDHGLIDWARLNTGLPDMNPTDYRGQTAGDVLRDISLKTGLNHYARYRDASSDIELAFYNANTSTLDSSTLRVSNDPADVNYTTTWPPFHPVRLHRKGDRVNAGVLVQGTDGIQSYDYDYDTSYEFGFRDMVVSDNNTTTQAGADALVERLLRQHNEQDERITVLRIQVPAANLNDVKHGQRIEAKFVHLPGWEAFRWARVVVKAFGRPDNDTQALYDVDLELSPQVPESQEQYGTDAQLQQVARFTWPQGTPGAGTLLVGVLASRDTPGVVNATTVPHSHPTWSDALFGYNPGADWTSIAAFDIESGGGGAAGDGLAMAWRNSTVADTAYIAWEGTPDQTYGRPRSHQMQIAGLSGAPTVQATQGDQIQTGTTYTSPTIAATGAGYIIGGFHLAMPGPHDRPITVTNMAANAPTILLTGGWMHDGFGGYSMLVYRYVTGAGSYTLSIERTGALIVSDQHTHGWIAAFWAGPESPAFPAV